MVDVKVPCAERGFKCEAVGGHLQIIRESNNPASPRQLSHIRELAKDVAHIFPSLWIKLNMTREEAYRAIGWLSQLRDANIEPVSDMADSGYDPHDYMSEAELKRIR